MNKILILTVGGSHQPIIKSINDNKPDFTVFLCSDDSPTQKGSYTQITDRVTVKKDCDTSYLPNIPTQTNLKEGTWEIRKIKYFDDLDECYRISQNTINEMRQRFSPAEIIVDYTGGTKTMTAGLAASALDDGGCKIVLVSGIRSNLNKVKDKTEYVKPVAFYDTLAVKNIEQTKSLIKRFDYSGAVNILEATIRLPLSKEKEQDVQKYLSICRGFDSWDRFDHALAYEFLNPYGKYLVKYLALLAIIKNEVEKEDMNYLLVEDIILNAERRAVQGRYEDAVGRIYRAIEMIAQIRLKSKYKQDTVNIQIEALPVLNEDFRKKLETKITEGKERIQIGLRQSYELLVELNDSIFKPWYGKNEGKLIDFLQYRNNSLFAHGFKAVNQEIYNIKVIPIMDLIKELINDIHKAERDKLTGLRQFPQDLVNDI